jgi:hypothetical protein
LRSHSRSSIFSPSKVMGTVDVGAPDAPKRTR